MKKGLQDRLIQLDTGILGLDLELTVVAENDAVLRDEQQQAELFQQAHAKFNAGKLDECESDCKKLLESLGIGLHEKSQVRLLYSRLSTVSIEERKLELDRGVITMRALFKQPDQANILREYEQAAGDIMKQINELLKSPVQHKKWGWL